MSIEKFNPSFSGEVVPYTQVNTHVIQNIDNLEAGFIWIYLLSLPRDWNVVKEHVKKKFNIGERKLKSLFAYLNQHQLIEYRQKRSSKGQMEGTDIHVLNGSRFIKTCTGKSTGAKTAPTVKTAGSKTARAENGACGKEGTTKNINKQIKQKAERETFSLSFFDTESFPFSKDDLRLMEVYEIDEKLMFEKFKTKLRQKKKKKFTKEDINMWMLREIEHKNSKKSYKVEKSVYSASHQPYVADTIVRKSLPAGFKSVKEYLKATALGG